MPEAARLQRGTPRPEPRPFRVIHLMAVVAASALSLSIPPMLTDALVESRRSFEATVGILRHPWEPAERLAHEITVGLVLWSSALAPIGILSNRRRLRRAGRSYGVASAIGAFLGVAFLSVSVFSSGVSRSLRGRPIFPSAGSYHCPAVWDLLDVAPTGLALAVLTAWTILAVSAAGRWPSDWFEIACLAFGITCVAWPLGRAFLWMLSS